MGRRLRLQILHCNFETSTVVKSMQRLVRIFHEQSGKWLTSRMLEEGRSFLL